MTYEEAVQLCRQLDDDDWVQIDLDNPADVLEHTKRFWSPDKMTLLEPKAQLRARLVLALLQMDMVSRERMTYDPWREKMNQLFTRPVQRRLDLQNFIIPMIENQMGKADSD